MLEQSVFHHGNRNRKICCTRQGNRPRSDELRSFVKEQQDLVREERFRAREAEREAREAEKEQQKLQAQFQKEAREAEKEQQERQAKLQKEAREAEKEAREAEREHELRLARIKADQGSANHSGQENPSQTYTGTAKPKLPRFDEKQDSKGLRRAKAGTEMNGQLALVHY